MMTMVRCNAMSAFVEEEEISAPSAAGASSSAQRVGVNTTLNMPMPMVRCSAMSWTDTEAAGQLRVLVARRDLVTGDTTMTEEQTVERAHHTGSPAKKRFMEHRWCERLRQAMLRVDKRKP